MYTVSEGVKLDQSIRGRVMNTSCPTLSLCRLATLRRSSSRFVRVRGLCVPRRFSVYPVFPPRIPVTRIRLLIDSRARTQRLSHSLGVEKRLHANTWLQQHRYDQRARIHMRTNINVCTVFTTVSRNTDRREIHESEWVNVPCDYRARTSPTHHFHSPFALRRCPLPSVLCMRE